MGFSFKHRLLLLQLCFIVHVYTNFRIFSAWQSQQRFYSPKLWRGPVPDQLWKKSRRFFWKLWQKICFCEKCIHMHIEWYHMSLLHSKSTDNGLLVPLVSFPVVDILSVILVSGGTLCFGWISSTTMFMSETLSVSSQGSVVLSVDKVTTSDMPSCSFAIEMDSSLSPDEWPCEQDCSSSCEIVDKSARWLFLDFSNIYFIDLHPDASDLDNFLT